MPRRLEQAAQRGPELVGGRLAHGREPPVLDQLSVTERAEVGLRVADVDDQQHGHIECLRRRPDDARTVRVAIPATYWRRAIRTGATLVRVTPWPSRAAA